jgi:transcriptional regulator with XRE-family HTH domain
MKRTKSPVSIEKRRVHIARKVGALRKERHWTQAELSTQLGLSQARLSQIERGDGSFTAEQFLSILELFNVRLEDFGEKAPDRGAQLQNSLARLGALHLTETTDELPSDRLRDVINVVHETLVVAESPRHITALAPVLVVHASNVKLRVLETRLSDVGHARRLGWLLDNIVAATQRELADPISRKWKQVYRRAELLLSAHVDSMTTRGLAAWSKAEGAWDVLDPTIRSAETLREVVESSSPISQRWGIATSVQTTDFIRALKAARVD